VTPSTPPAAATRRHPPIFGDGFGGAATGCAPGGEDASRSCLRAHGCGRGLAPAAASDGTPAVS
jgi:hypothetical protein